MFLFSIEVVGANLSDPPVRVYLDGVEFGNDALGTITANGLYAAPAVPPTPNVVTLRVVSADDVRQWRTAEILILPRPGSVTVTVSPDAVELPLGASSGSRRR